MFEYFFFVIETFSNSIEFLSYINDPRINNYKYLFYFGEIFNRNLYRFKIEYSDIPYYQKLFKFTFFQ